RLLANRGALGNRVDHRPAEILRMRTREADPLDPLDGVAGAQQLAELRAEPGSEIAPPRVDVLAQERDLAHAFASEARHLGDHVSGTPADLTAAHGRDDAVRALRVAAHRDLHPGLERALTVRRQLTGEGPLVEAEPPALDAEPARAQPLAEVRDRAGPEGDVDIGVELEETLSLRLGVAPADGDHLAGIVLLQCRRLRQAGSELQVGLLADRARVEDEDVRRVLRRRLAEPQLFEHALDPLAVMSVHLAAERGDVIPPHGPEWYPWSFRTPPRSGSSV